MFAPMFTPGFNLYLHHGHLCLYTYVKTMFTPIFTPMVHHIYSYVYTYVNTNDDTNKVQKNVGMTQQR